MANTGERIQELIHKLNEKHHSWILITAAMWTEEEWAEERAESDRLTAELKELLPIRIAELKDEQTELERKYPKFTKRLRYFFKAPKEVTDAEFRYNQIFSEIKYLKSYL